ncbi:hypothetical protein [Indioceanicola profundi]|uniref:hypothetical protein n=1 Tax=Indioceanicola profundi TaxID=2220096 RepID=UPI0013C3FEF5|nr:hypothetical protein [Indioceanicola profundi]
MSTKATIRHRTTAGSAMRRAVGLCLVLAMVLAHFVGVVGAAAPAMASPTMTMPCDAMGEMTAMSDLGGPGMAAQPPCLDTTEDGSAPCQVMDGMSCFAMCAITPPQAVTLAAMRPAHAEWHVQGHLPPHVVAPPQRPPQTI